MAQWEYLPDLVLINIMSFLPRKDRFFCGMVCRRWARILETPRLWKHLNISVDVDLKEPWTTIMTEKFYRYIVSLNFTWSKAYLPRQWIRERLSLIIHDCSKYFLLLTSKKVQLKCFRLKNWFFAWKFKKMTLLLAEFVGTQKRLQYVNIFNANLSSTEVLKLLSSCSKSSSETLQYLDIQNSYHEWQTPFTLPRFVRVIERMEVLKVLKLDYTALSEEILYAIAGGVNRSLSYIDIYVRDTDSRSHVIDSKAWRAISNKLVKLRVGLKIVNISHYEELFPLLPEDMPLEQLILKSGYFWDQSKSRNLVSTMELIISNYKDTLVKVHLLIRNNRENLDDLLILMLEKCTHLSYLEYDGILRSMNLLKQICFMQCDTKEINFKKINVWPRSLNYYNHSMIYEIQRDYAKKMLNDKVDFKIEGYSPVLLYC